MKDLRPLVHHSSKHLVRSTQKVDATSLTVLKSDILLLQKRIDLLDNDKPLLSHDMQQQERLLLSLPTAEEEGDLQEVKNQLFEVVIDKVRELSLQLLRVRSKNPKPEARLESLSRPVSTASQSKGPLSLSGPIPLTPLAHPLGPPNPVSRASFVEAFVAFVDEVATSGIEDFAESIGQTNLSEQRQEQLAGLRRDMEAREQELQLHFQTRTTELQQQHAAETDALRAQLEDCKAQIASMSTGKDKSKGAVPKDLTKELKEMAEENRKLVEEMDATREQMSLVQGFCEEAKGLALRGLGDAAFLNTLGLEIDMPSLPAGFSLTGEHTAPESHTTTTRRPSVHSQRKSSNTAQLPTKGKKNKEDQVETMAERHRLHVEGLTIGLSFQNKILLELQKQLPVELQRRDHTIESLTKEKQRSHEQLQATLHDKDLLVKRTDKALRDKQAAVDALQKQVATLEQQQREAMEEATLEHDLLRTRPHVMDGRTAPVTLVQKFKGQHHTIGQMEKHLSEVKSTSESAQAQVQQLARQLGELQVENTSLGEHNQELQTKVTELQHAFDLKSSEFDAQEAKLKSTNGRLSKTLEQSASAFERVKMLELRCEGAAESIATLQTTLQQTTEQHAQEAGTSSREHAALVEQHSIDCAVLEQRIRKGEQAVERAEAKLKEVTQMLQVARAELNNISEKVDEVLNLAGRLLQLQFSVLGPNSKGVIWHDLDVQLQSITSELGNLSGAVDDNWAAHITTLRKEAQYISHLVKQKL
eukprot:NODE_340_length_2382_cov_53.500665_g318_i0.p1 GENE.NODE_340_length_2382_cov_53.500665_g318_i0~~NODE_340_length_2382_cov_53.500665_g318_i0.p1  ORF type:complete len:767 (-),score=253.40 NODE_340_length_2382_cov_53.500665_g318_i0:82-2358(-)